MVFTRSIIAVCFTALLSSITLAEELIADSEDEKSTSSHSNQQNNNKQNDHSSNETPAQTPAEACNSNQGGERVIDRTFDYLNTRFCQPAVWFDNFFVDERTDGDAKAGTIIRWYNDFSLVENEGYQFKTRFKARFHLPEVTRRLKVVFETDDEDDVFDLFPTSTENAESTLGLQYDWIQKARQSFNIKITAKPGIEGRFRYTYPISVDTTATIVQRIYQKKRVTGEKTEIDIDHSINKEFLFRWSNFATYEDDIKGWELGSGFTLYQFISDHQAMSYQASTTGTNRPYHYISNTHLSATYRQSFFRPWLFLELTPEYNWFKEEDIERYQEAKFTLRLEVLFQNI
ncbi:hypothetical protein [Vibrio sp. 10N.261.55.A7]|uniref:hypothetical protein n=1 Tax=Vibrio sp. 10N.261.55.A7 TaxID=1880851 RepID=UPI001F536C93|nr:hypothetical protein [Vibrio sp. 10N.261.55.A7]